jgi:hypothetical protein
MVPSRSLTFDDIRKPSYDQKSMVYSSAITSTAPSARCKIHRKVKHDKPFIVTKQSRDWESKERRESMTEETEVENSSDWMKFIRKHWNTVAVFVIAIILAVIGAIYVFWWFTGDAQTTGLVPSTLGLWSMANVVIFILHLIFWELIFIGIPAIIGAVIAWQWWKRLPDEEKKEYHLSGRRSRSRDASGAISPLLFIAFAIKVYVDGNWDAAISTYTLNYVVDSMIIILAWIAVIFGIPAAIGLIWWIHHVVKKTKNEG